jgi:hypothetical protein
MKLSLFSATILALSTSIGMAQQASTTAATSTTSNTASKSDSKIVTNNPTIQQRKTNQQQRIGNGVKSGALTAGETRNLESREASINHEEHNMRQAENGKLTNTDKADLTRRQNRTSKAIYRDKHNDATQNQTQNSTPNKPQQ